VYDPPAVPVFVLVQHAPNTLAIRVPATFTPAALEIATAVEFPVAEPCAVTFGGVVVRSNSHECHAAAKIVTALDIVQVNVVVPRTIGRVVALYAIATPGNVPPADVVCDTTTYVFPTESDMLERVQPLVPDQHTTTTRRRPPLSVPVPG